MSLLTLLVLAILGPNSIELRLSIVERDESTAGSEDSYEDGRREVRIPMESSS